MSAPDRMDQVSLAEVVRLTAKKAAVLILQEILSKEDFLCTQCRHNMELLVDTVEAPSTEGDFEQKVRRWLKERKKTTEQPRT